MTELATMFTDFWLFLEMCWAVAEYETIYQTKERFIIHLTSTEVNKICYVCKHHGISSHY